MHTLPLSRRLLIMACLALIAASGCLAAAEPPAQANTADATEAAAAIAQLADIRAAIHAKAANWQARLTSVASLPLAAKRRLAGVPESRPHQPSFTNAAFRRQNTKALPAQFDWRSVNGHSYVSAIKNQGHCGSCWAFAVTGALESQAMISQNLPDQNIDLSDQVVLSCSKAGSCDGGWPDQASAFLTQTGTPGDSYFPYTATDTACGQAASGWHKAAYRLQSWQYVVSNATPSVDLLKNALYNTGPLVTTMRVYEDFYYYGSGVYSHVSGNYVGDHAIVIVGWDDAAQAMIVKNSWGTDWGDNGFFRIDYSELSGDTQFGDQMTLADGPAITPSLTPPKTPDKLKAPVGGNAAVEPAFIWRPVAHAQRYYLTVRASDGRVVQTTDYAASSLGCALDIASCKARPKIALTPGQSYRWSVLAAGRAGYSDWSAEQSFTVRAE